MPIYQITTEGEEKARLVKATSAPAAIAHCAKSKFSAKLVTSVEAAADLLADGVKIETAGEAPAEPPQQQEPDDERTRLPEIEFARTGETYSFDGHDLEIRVNEKSGNVEVHRGPGNHPTHWPVVRPATEDELAAEKERAAAQ